MAQVKKLTDSGRKIIILFGAVYDITEFYSRHPGGKEVLDAYDDGKDATEAFVEAGHLTKMRVVELLAALRLGPFTPTAKL